MENEMVDAGGSWDEISLENAPDEDLRGDEGRNEGDSGCEKIDAAAETEKGGVPETAPAQERFGDFHLGHEQLLLSAMPENMKSAVRRGMSLGEAARSCELERLRNENMALRQARENAARCVGSAGTEGRRSFDAFDEAWYDGT